MCLNSRNNTADWPLNSMEKGFTHGFKNAHLYSQKSF